MNKYHLYRRHTAKHVCRKYLRLEFSAYNSKEWVIKQKKIFEQYYPEQQFIILFNDGSFEPPSVIPQWELNNSIIMLEEL
jgi:hypothetical protein